MSKIKEIEMIIIELIKTNEKIVTKYDPKLLCSSYDDTLKEINQLLEKKKGLMDKLVYSMNEFFQIKENFITRKLKFNSFRLVPTFISFEYRFFIPKSVDVTSRQYFCYICMMDKLLNEYDVISLKHDGYYFLDISATLNLNKFYRGDKYARGKC